MVIMYQESTLALDPSIRYMAPKARHLSPVRQSVPRLRTICPAVLSVAADVLELRAWKDRDPLAGILMAGFAAICAQPLVYGSMGTSIVALMTPVR
jgi:hypothetical protein